MSRPMSASALALALVPVLGLCACEGRNLGISPVGQGLYFPAAMTLDPRVPDGTAARWLMVANANSALNYNAGSLVAVDLDRFFNAWMNCADLCLLGTDDGTCSAEAKADPCGVKATVRDVGEDVEREAPCRHVAFRPQVIECEDTFMLAEQERGLVSVRMGSFISALRGYVEQPGSGEAMLLASVKADPSITWIDLKGGLEPFDAAEPYTPTDLSFGCGQPDPDLDDPGRCSRTTHTLRFPFDDQDYPRIGPEPTNILVSKYAPWAYVTFSTTPEVILIDLQAKNTGPLDRATKPMIVDARNIFIFGNQASGGGWGLAERPCVEGEAPSITNDCTRPLLYGAFRTNLLLARMFPDTVDPLTYADAIAALEQQKMGADPAEMAAIDKEIEHLQSLKQTCLDGDGVGEEGEILCDPQLFFAGFARAAGFDINGNGSLGDIAFSRDGKRLFVVQSAPASLVYVDTSVTERGEVRDQAAGVVELCGGPTAMRLFEDDANEYAAVTCPTPSELFIVDLSGFRVVANVPTGAGPYPIVFDRVRRLLYVGNTLDRTISVIDIAQDRPTRFAEIARVGLQTPYKR